MHTILQRQVLLKDAVYKIAQIARDTDPAIARVYIETSDQGEYLTATHVTYRDSEVDESLVGYLDEQLDTDDAVSIEDWASSLSWGDANDEAPGWHTLNNRGGYYYIDVDEALAVEEPVEIKPVDLVNGALGLHQSFEILQAEDGWRCSCGGGFTSTDARRQHVAEKIVEVLS